MKATIGNIMKSARWSTAVTNRNVKKQQTNKNDVNELRGFESGLLSVVSTARITSYQHDSFVSCFTKHFATRALRIISICMWSKTERPASGLQDTQRKSVGEVEMKLKKVKKKKRSRNVSNRNRNRNVVKVNGDEGRREEQQRLKAWLGLVQCGEVVRQSASPRSWAGCSIVAVAVAVAFPCQVIQVNLDSFAIGIAADPVQCHYSSCCATSASREQCD